MSGDIYISGKSSNNKITISGSSKKNDIDLSTKETNNNLSAQNNNAKYYSDKALESAEKAEKQANLAKGYAESVVEIKNELLNNEDFKTVVTNIDNINTVGENIENVITIAEDLEQIADNLDVINNVNDNLDTISTVNTNIQDINTVASNIEDIQNAEENASIAKEKAQESADYSKLSKQWAISDELVENTDYSSKYYSEKSKEQADIATSKTNEVVESGNNAITEITELSDSSKQEISSLTTSTLSSITSLSNNTKNEISTLKTNALEDITNTKNVAISDIETLTDNSKTEIETLGNEKIDIATVQTEIAITKASEASQSASNSLKSAENSALSEASAKESENNAKTSEQNALNSSTIATQQANIAKEQAQIAKDEVAKLSTVYKYKGSVATVEDLPTNANVGDVYDTQETGMNYAWNGSEWDELGGTFDVSWGSLKGNISDNTELQNALDSKVSISGNETITGQKTFSLTDYNVLKVHRKTAGGSFLEFINNNGFLGLIGTSSSKLPTWSSDKLVTNRVLVMGGSNTSPQIGNEQTPIFINSSGVAQECVNIATTVDITNSLTNYALKSDIPDVTSFITIADVEAKGYLTSIPEEYITDTELENKGYLTEIPSEYITDTELSTYAYDKATVDGKIAEAVTGGSVDLSGYAKDNEVVHLANDETITGVKTFNGRVNFLGNSDANAIYLSENTRINVNGTTRTVLGFASGNYLIGHSNYATIIRGQGERPYFGTGTSTSTAKTLALTSDIPDVSNFATKDDIPKDYATKSELVEKQDTLTAGENIEIKDNVISAKSGSMAIGTILSVNANSSYVPDGTLPCDGAEYAREQFDDFCKNFLDGEYSQFLATCTYAQYEEEIATYGQCSKFAVYGNTTITKSGNKTTTINVSPAILQAYPNGIELEFTYDGSNWTLDSDVVNLSDYYITASGTYSAGDTFKVSAGLVQKFRVPLIKDTETVVTNNIDYANGIKITTCPLAATPFVAPYDGVFVFTFYENINKFSYCYINGVLSPHQFNDGDATNVSNTYHIPLSKGDSIYWDVDVVIRDGAFFPYKEEEKEKLKSFVVVANGQTNQSLMDWSSWASSLQGKANIDLGNCTSPIVSAPYIVEVSDKSILPSWYRVWSDGWCEQGGHLGTASATKYTVSFLKEFIDTNYSLISTDSTGTSENSDTGGADDCVYLGNYTTTGFTVSIAANRQESSWEAKGYIK